MKIKKCKRCWEPRWHSNPLISLCVKCSYNKDTNNAWKVAKFTSDTKASILIRDKSCVLCKWSVMDYHHVYFSMQAERNETRNNIEKGVGLCRSCHDKCHACRSWHWERQECIDYLINL